ncbi:PD-(D/E)XK nuclease family protein [Fangia hongkongensis]|uniref:PD-(D/E)XK nuclease family protein n=1 Tax=Fangia hongkongensis TaxID=270495 RepID=UPI0003735DB8|nr:PD-(D/E)XK nuclease family protein [Fangia hongkongensis]MBK2125605.1 PD-(D/E)XK nuclease family protein [Fangia hongkongensis]
MSKSFYNSLIQKIDEHTLVIAATNRLSEHLFTIYLEYAHATGSKVLFDEKVFGFRAWQQLMYQQMLIENKGALELLSNDESSYLFELIISKDESVFSIGKKERALIESAYQMMCEWNMPLSSLNDYTENVNVANFLRWSEEFDRYCQRNNVIHEAKLASYLLEMNALESFVATKEIRQVFFVGFDTFTPMMVQLIQSLASLGVSVNYWQLATEEKSSSYYYAFENDEKELEAVSREVERLHKNEPDLSIGVIVPDLQRQFRTLQRVFDQALLPEEIKAQLSIDNSLRPYVISGGVPLAEIPVISQLLLWLHLDDMQDCSKFFLALCSPYIKGAPEYQAARQQLVYQFTDKMMAQSALKEALSMDLFTSAMDESLLMLLQECSGLLMANEHKRYSAYEFIALLKKLIKVIAWPGEMVLDSTEYQAVNKFYLAINNLMKFERMALNLSYRDWVYRLQALVQATVFQTESNLKAKIHILGVLESSEIAFDRLYVIRMSDANWPSLTPANPFLPIGFQREHNMPHSSSEKELEFAESVTKRLLNQSKDVRFSYAMLSQKMLQLPSPLLSEIAVEQKEIELNNSLVSIVLKECKNKLSSLDAEEKTSLKGGSSVLKNMAECPYRAQLVHRLCIKPFPSYKKQLDSLEKGVLIHYVLESVFRVIKDASTLKSLNEGELDALIREHVDSALLVHQAYLLFVPDFMREVERKRLIELVRNWLQYEKLREVDFEVVALEKRVDVKIFGVNLSLRVDRVDRLVTGHTVVIDYKTSKKFELKRLLDTPVTEPQLPLYAVFEDADAIAVALVNAAKVEFKALSNTSSWISENVPKAFPRGVRHDLAKELEAFSDLKAHWRGNFESLMQAFASGDDMLKPSAHTCRYCDFGRICRHKYN